MSNSLYINLPYITISTNLQPLKFILDTGATHSIVNPGLCDPKWKIPTDILQIRTLQHIINVSEKVRIPLFKEFGDPKSRIDFYVCRFHDLYDGLIGNNILRQLKAKIDYENNILHIGNKTIPLQFEVQNAQYYLFSKDGNYDVDIPVNQKEGLMYISGNTSKDGRVEILEGAYEVTNYLANTTVAIKDDLPKRIKFNMKAASPVTCDNFYVSEEPSLFKSAEEQIRCTHLNSEEKLKLFQIIKKFRRIFYNNEKSHELTFTNVIKHEIRTVDHAPISAKTYRYPYIHKSEVQHQIQEMLENNIIRPSHSPYSAPVWVVPKKMDASGKQKWRLVIDYRKLNEVTIDDKYPIPNMDEILEKLGRCQYFTTLDLAKGFHQIEISENDIHKTAFSVEGGHYEFLRMPFGLKTAPATFQRLMNIVLGDYINKICLVYLDDIIIFSTSLQEHLESITKIFQRLRDTNLKIQLDKSEFLKHETEFLGHVVSNEGIKPNPQKVECVQKFPLPKTAKEIKGFLGLTGYYRKFIKDYAKIAKPITKYLKKDTKINTNDPEYIGAFETLKRLLMNDPILSYPDFTKKFILQTDASNFALGAVLSQEGHPVCYASRTLNDHEQNYSTIEKELLAIVWATQYFRPYLFGRKFLVETDHRPLAWLFSVKEPNSKLVRWRLRLAEYDYEIKYKKGVQNGNADALSRAVINQIQLVSPIIIESSCPINLYKKQIILKKINSGSLKVRNLKIFKSERIIVYAKNFDEDTLITLIKKHFAVNRTHAILIEDDVVYNNFKEIIKNKFKNGSDKFKIIRCKLIVKDVTDEIELLEYIENEHARNNHRGINENFNQLKNKIYHPNLKDRITKFINNCEICNKEKYDRRPIKQQFKITDTPYGPREIVHVDVFYSLNKSLFLTFIDKFSKHAQAIKISNRSWIEFKKAISQYLSAVGNFKKLITDNELGLKAIPLQTYLREQNIETHFTSNNNHTSNSDIERLHNTINEHLRLLRHDPNKDTETVEEKIYRIVNFYNNTIHSTTGQKPIDFVNGVINRDDYPTIRLKIIKIKETIINKLNKNREDAKMQTGPVFIKEERGGKNHSKFRKIYVQSLDSEHVVTGRGHKYYKSHIKRQKKYQNNQNHTIELPPGMEIIQT